MVAKKPVKKSGTNKNTKKDEDKQSPRSQAASNRALSQYVNKVVADMKKEYPGNKEMQFGVAASIIAEQSENKKQAIRLTNRAANKIGIEKYLASHGYKFGEATPKRIKSKKDR